MKVKITKSAISNLEKSLNFYREKLNYTDSHLREITNTLFEKVNSLSENPEKGQIEPNLSKLNLSHRRVIVGNFKVIYRIERNTIIVTDFFDSRRNPNKMKG